MIETSIEAVVSEAATHLTAGDVGRAKYLCGEVLSAVTPEHQADAWNLLGLCCMKERNPPLAEAMFKMSLVCNPNAPGAWSNIAEAQEAQKQGLPPKLQQAELSAQQALTLDENCGPAWNVMGMVLGSQNRMRECIGAFKQGIRRNPGCTTPYANLIAHLQRMGRIKEAVEFGYAGIEIAPKMAEMHWNLALVLLASGDYRQGWHEYEWRWKSDGFTCAPVQINAPRWNGESLEGRHIALWAEQGLGDTIQFIRYARLVSDAGAAKVTAVVQPELVGLIRSMRNVLGITDVVDHPVQADYQCPLLSLPMVFDTTVATIPWFGPYISADKLQNSGDRIGVCWKGSAKHRNDSARSMQPDDLLPLQGVDGIQWVSMQFGEQPPEWMSNGLADAKSFTDTVEALSRLKLLITVDTSIAHLAGAMGIPVLLLVATSNDWRWMQDRTDTPWYPSMRIVRQRPGDTWRDVMRRVARDLSKSRLAVAA